MENQTVLLSQYGCKTCTYVIQSHSFTKTKIKDNKLVLQHNSEDIQKSLLRLEGNVKKTAYTSMTLNDNLKKQRKFSTTIQLFITFFLIL